METCFFAAQLDQDFADLLREPWQGASFDDLDLLGRGVLVASPPSMPSVVASDPVRFGVGHAARMARQADAAFMPRSRAANVVMPMWCATARTFMTPPAGAVIAALRLTADSPYLQLNLDWQVAWLRPAWRGRGFGYHLAAHFASFVTGLAARFDWAARLRQFRCDGMRVSVRVAPSLPTGMRRLLQAALAADQYHYAYHCQARRMGWPAPRTRPLPIVAYQFGESGDMNRTMASA
jgi:hypothetical protein